MSTFQETFAPLQELADAQARAWQELAVAAGNVATLPWRAVGHLVGLTPLEAPSAVDARVEALGAALEHAEKGRLDAVEALAQAEAEHRGAVAVLVEEHRELVNELRRGYGVLEAELETRVAHALEDQKRALYGLLEPLLTQLPMVRRAVAQGQPVEAADVLALMGPLDEALRQWGITPIGAVGEETPFDPAQHQGAFEPGTPVTVKTIGYKLDEKILRKARVSA